MRSIPFRWPLVFSALLLMAPGPAFALPYTFTLLDVPGATETRAFGLNDRLQIVGDYSDTSGHGFVYAGGAFTPLDAPGASQTDAFGINRAGQIVGVAIDLAGIHGFLDRNGRFTSVDVPGNSGGTEAFGINGRGEIVGLYFTDSARQGHGFLERSGHFTTIDVPGAAQTQLDGINRSGEMVGVFLPSDHAVFHGFVDDRGTVRMLEPPNATSSGAFGINNHGQIVGDFSDTQGSHGFLYSDGSFLTIDLPGFEGRTFARGIDQRGDIVGFVRDDAGNFHGYMGTPTPEPSTLVLFGTGLIATWAVGRRQKRAGLANSASGT